MIKKDFQGLGNSLQIQKMFWTLKQPVTLLSFRAASPIDNEYVTHEGRSTFYGGTSSQGSGDPKYILDTVSTASEEEESKNNSKE